MLWGVDCSRLPAGLWQHKQRLWDVLSASTGPGAPVRGRCYSIGADNSDARIVGGTHQNMSCGKELTLHPSVTQLRWHKYWCTGTLGGTGALRWERPGGG